jgi:hypothetical protein
VAEVDQNWFAETGARLEADWSSAARDEEAFPEIAERLLEGRHPREHIDLDAFIARTLDPSIALPTQLARPGVFGQPGITAYAGNGFVIEIYFWSSSSSAIHNHPFCGLFTLLRGFSLHVRYRFEPEAELGNNVRIGRVSVTGIERLAPPAHVLFSLRRHPLIHSLVHVPNPSVSLVIRTTRTEDYWRYLPPTVALRIGTDPPELERRLMLLDFLRRSDDPSWERQFSALIASHDAGVAIAALSRLYGDSRGLARSIELVRAHHGDLVDGIATALARAHRRHRDGVTRDRLADAEERYIATVLSHADDRARVFALLRERYGTAARTKLVAFIERCVYAPEQPGLDVARLLADEQVHEDVRADVARPAMERYFRGSLLEALLPWPDPLPLVM